MKIIVIELSRRERRIASGLVALAVCAAGSIALASVPNTFEPGQTLRASELNANFTELDERIAAVESGGTPAGAVIAFDRETCPPGWSAYAPAAGRTISGVNLDTENGLAERQRGDKFGEESHTLTVAQLPAHHHDVSIYSGVGPFENGDDDLVAVGGSTVAAYYGGSATSEVGDGQAFTNLQPSLALLYCTKD